MKTGRWSWSSFLGVVLMATPAHLAAQQQVYQYDDGEFESGLFSTAHETQSAQRARKALPMGFAFSPRAARFSGLRPASGDA